MATRSGTALTSGTAHAVKFAVAALAFAGAYAGLPGPAPAGPAPTRTATLSARELPATTPAQARTVLTPTRAGTIAVSALPDGAACVTTFAARAVVDNPDPGRTLSYRWRLARWNAATGTWRTYLVHHAGFTGASRDVEWDPAVSGNPGWYRVELRAAGARTVRSERLQVRC